MPLTPAGVTAYFEAGPRFGVRLGGGFGGGRGAGLSAGGPALWCRRGAATRPRQRLCYIGRYYMPDLSSVKTLLK